MKDICAITGSRLVDNYDLSLSDVQLSDFGKASLIKLTEHETTIVGGVGDLETRIEEVKGTIEREEKTHLKNVHKDRLSRLQASIAEI